MKRRVISAALALCMMLTLLSGTALAAGQHPFTDVPQSHWANEAVGYVYENDLMNGVSATMFQPGGSLTRAMFVTILGRMAGAEEESGESGSADVPAGRWYSAYVAWAAGEGIVDGTGNGCFSPNSPVTREQMATMIARYVDSADLPLPETGDPAAPFTDRNAVSDWAEAGGELMRQTGILAGDEDGTFQPQRTANRAEAATIFMRLEQTVNASPQSPEEAAIEAYETVAAETRQIERKYENTDGVVPREKLEPLLQEVAAYAEQLQNQGTVTNYEVNDTCVYMKVGGWLGFLYAPPEEGMMAGGQEGMEIITLEPFPGEMYASYLLAGGKGPDQAAEDLEDSFGPTLTYQHNYDGDAVSVDTLKNLPQHSIILWSGHGNYVDRLGSVLFLGTKKWDQSTILLYAQEFGDEALLVNQNGQFYISPIFFEKYMPQDAFAGSLIYLGTCQSFADRRLAESIWDKGAEVILGNTRTVRQIYNFKMLYSFAEGLTQRTEQGSYYTISQALEYAKEKHGSADTWGYNSEVKALYREDVTLEEIISPEKTTLEDLVGVYEGSYFASQGETGLTLTVYEENGGYRALFDFYNLPGRTNAKEGSYTMDVTVTDQGAFRFDADQWVEKPSGYRLLDLEGTLQGEVLSGQSPTRFSVTRTGQAVPDTGWKQAYQRFLAEQGYTDYLDDWFYQPTEYALLDLNQDGMKELILQGNYFDTFYDDFYNFSVFTYDARTKQVVIVPLADGTSESNAPKQVETCYGELMYSPQYQSLVFTDLRPYYVGTTAISNYGYYTLNNGSLQMEQSIGTNHSEDYSQIYYEIHTSDGGSTVISAEEYREYISERDPIAFEPLP